MQDHNNGIKLLAADAWFTQGKNTVSGFLLKDDAETWVRGNGGKVFDFAAIKTFYAGAAAHTAHAEDREASRAGTLAKSSLAPGTIR